MDTPKLQPITNKLKHNSGNVNNSSPANEGPVDSGYGANARFNNGSSGNGSNGSINDAPNNPFGPGDRRFNYSGPPRRDFIGDRSRYKYVNHSETYHRSNYSQHSDQPPYNSYHASQWNQNRYYNGPHNRNRWANDYNYNNGSNYNSNSKYQQEEPGRRIDNPASPCIAESNRKSLNSERNINTTLGNARTEKNTESTPTGSNKIIEESSHVEIVGAKSFTHTSAEPDRKKAEDSTPAQKIKTPKLNELRVSPRKRAHQNNCKVSSKRVKTKNAPKNAFGNSKSSNISKDKFENLVTESNKDNAISKEPNSTSENLRSSKELNADRSEETNKVVENCIEQVVQDSIKINSLNLPTDSIKTIKKVEKRKLTKVSSGAKSKRDIKENSANEPTIDDKSNIAKNSANLLLDFTKNSANENKTDIAESRNLSAVIERSESIEIETNVQPMSPVIFRFEDEQIPEAPTLDISCIDIDFKTLDLPESRENIDEEISSLECRVSPVKDPNDKPRISIIPLSRLIRNELIELTDYSSVTEFEDVPTPILAAAVTPKKHVCRPNLVKRRRKISTCSNSSGTTENLIEKVAGMDKFGIKQVINNSGTRFDEALKAQARKRLREEIRKQLKSMNLETVKDSEDVNFVPDEIVDAICIPDVVLEEIRKAFGIEIFYKGNPKTTPVKETAAIAKATVGRTATSNSSPPLQESIVETTSTAVQPAKETATKKPQAKTQNRVESNRECDKVQKVVQGPQSAKTLQKDKETVLKIENKQEVKNRKGSEISTTSKNSHKKGHRDVILIESSSSSNSSSSSSSSSSDSDSDSSAKSTSSSVKRRKRKVRVDSQNIVDNFEKLILPNLSDILRIRYRNKYSNSTYTRLHFISCICTSEYNTRKFTKNEIAKIQSNLKSEDRSFALDFLMREIVNVFNKQKEAAKKERGNNKAMKDADGVERPHRSERVSGETSSTRGSRRWDDAGGSSYSAHKANGISKQSEKYTASSRSKANGISTQAVKDSSNSSSGNRKSANAAEKVDVRKNSMQSSRTPPPKKNQHQSVNEQTLMSKRDEEKERGKSAGDAKTANVGAVSGANNNLQLTTNQQDSNGKSVASAITRQQLAATATAVDKGTVNEQQQHNPTVDSANSRAHLSESSGSVCLQSPSITRSLLDNNCSGSGAPNLLIGNENSSNGLCGMPSLISSTVFPNVDIEALRQRKIISEFAVNNIRECDMKLMELHKRKMFIDEMILKLQKDKMDVDMQTMQLQNEKFLLLNSAMTAAASELPKRDDGTAAGTSPVSPFAPVQYADAQTLFTSPVFPRTTARAIQTNANHRKRKAFDNNAPNAKRKRGGRKRGGVGRNAVVIPTKLECIPKTTTETVKIASPISKSPTVEAGPRDCGLSPVISNLEQTYSDLDPPPFNCEDLPCSAINVKSPLTQVHLYGGWIVATGEDGRLYQFSAKTLIMEMEFAKHSETITHSYLCHEKKVLYTTSLDGYMKKTSLENFALDIQSVYLQEPLQCIEVQWGSAYIGSRWGNIFTYDIESNNCNNVAISSSETSITAIKATKEGPRRILIVASKSKDVQIRDASSGLLLRTITLPEPLKAYSLLLDDGCIYCGTQRSNILKLDFTTGQQLSTIHCGSGAVSMRLYESTFLLVGSYDGFMYVIDKTKERLCGRYADCSGSILTLAVVSNKIIVTAKDKTLRVISIPQNK